MKSIGIDEEMHQNLKLLSIATHKKIYELIKESIVYLKEKYHDQMRDMQQGI